MLLCMSSQQRCVITDFRLSQQTTVDVNSIFGWLHHVNVSDADVLEVHAASIFWVKL
jgi:hypothetical protein